MTSIVVRSYDHGRKETVGAMADRLWNMLSAVGGVHAKLSAWHARASDGALVPLENARDCVEAIQRREYTWRSGSREHVAYGPVIIAGASTQVAEVSVVCGVEPSPIWTPNQVQLSIDVGSGILADDAGVLGGILNAVVQSYDPAWGHVSIDGRPAAPMPPFANGTPVVGWITFLSRDYPPAPTVLPAPAVAYQGEKGVLFVAHPKLPDSEAIERLRSALAQAHVLVPAPAVQQNA